MKPVSVAVVPHGVSDHFRPLDFSDRESLCTALGLADKFVFLHVSAMTPNKNPSLLLSAFAKVQERFSNTHLFLKGDDDMYSSEARLLGSPAGGIYARLKEQGHVTYLGSQLTSVEMSTLHQACDCYVSPYSYEGFNLPVLEALASGLKVIVTEGGSTDDFVGKEGGGRWKVKAELNVIEGVQRAKNGQKGAFRVEGHKDDELFVDVVAKELVVDEVSGGGKRGREAWREERRVKR